MKLFRRLLNARVLNCIVIYEQCVERNVDHLKYRIDLVEGLLVKYSVQHGGSGHHDDDITIKRLMEHHFLRGILPTDK